MVEFCESNDIKLLPFGTVAGGFLSERYLGVPASSCAPQLAIIQLVFTSRPAHILAAPSLICGCPLCLAARAKFYPCA